MKFIVSLVLLMCVFAAQGCASAPPNPSCTPEAVAAKISACFSRAYAECVVKEVPEAECKALAECDTLAEEHFKTCGKVGE